jgi:hypothetical protein
MKGLSLTLSIVVVAIALIVTVLVVTTVFNKEIANFVSILNPWAEEKSMENLCQDRCASYCRMNIGKAGTDWKDLGITIRGETTQCDEVMSSILGEDIGSCRC